MKKNKLNYNKYRVLAGDENFKKMNLSLIVERVECLGGVSISKITYQECKFHKLEMISFNININ